MTKLERNSKGGKRRWKGISKAAKSKAMREVALARWKK